MTRLSKIALAGTLGIAAALVASGFTMTASAAPAGTRAVTQVHTFNPWTATGKLAPGIKVTQREKASGCTYRSSFDLGNRDAWRCFPVSGGFYDPCFAAPNGSHVTQVACVANAWAGKAVILTLAKPLAHSSWGTPPPATAKFPWAMVLANGQRCGVIGGTSQVVDGVGLYYACPRGFASDPGTGTEPWTVKYQALGSSRLTTVAVAASIR